MTCKSCGAGKKGFLLGNTPGAKTPATTPKHKVVSTGKHVPNNGNNPVRPF